MIDLRQLYDIFEHQSDLMVKLAPVERELGYHPPTPPLDLQNRQHQQHFRMMAWFFTEEIVETLTAFEEGIPEELSDVLHFLVELCILGGVSPESVHAVQTVAPLLRPDLVDVLIQVGRATNYMKAKPWKRNPQSTNEDEVRYHLRLALAYLMAYFEALDLNPHRLYFYKNEINKQRIQNNY